MRQKTMHINNHEPGRQLHLKVRAGFVSQGTTLNGWCLQHNVKVSNARAALTGFWDGPRGRELRAELIAESGMPVSSAA